MSNEATNNVTDGPVGQSAATPQLLSINQISKGWINKYELTYQLPDGTLFCYEAVSRKPLERFRANLMHANQPEAINETTDCANATAANNAAAAENTQGVGASSDTADAVSIVGITPNNTVLLIREFRYTINNWCLAFPAGLVEAGEDLRTCADRELREETGYALAPNSDVRPLKQAGLSSTGLTDEAVRIMFAQVEKVAEPTPEPNEFIEVFDVPLTRLRDFLDRNTLPIGTRTQLVLEMYAACIPQES